MVPGGVKAEKVRDKVDTRDVLDLVTHAVDRAEVGIVLEDVVKISNSFSINFKFCKCITISFCS